jgi:CD109 antigen
MSIDPKVQEDAIDYILDQQNKDGSFPPVCKPIHKEMQGCSGGNCSLTAYVTLALLEAGVLPKTEAVSNALDYLSTQCMPSDCSNMYAVALIAYTMLKGDRNVEAERALRLLKDCAVTDGDHTYWQYEKTPSCVANSWSYYCRPRSCDVETTAYALLAFTSKEDIAYSLGIVRWLIEQRNPRGGFKSTQDTVVALQALSEYATLTTAGGCVSANVYLTAEELTHKVGVNSGNAMQIQTVQLPKIPTILSVRVCQVCCILASVGVRYNVPEPDETAAFEVTANVVKQKAACKYEVRVCNRWLSKETDSSNMAVSEVTFFSGFQPVQSELKQLEKIQQCMIKRTEFKGRVLSLYFDEIGRKECCFTVTMKRASVVADLQGVPVITYNYYEPDQRGGTMIYPREEC